MWETSYNLSWYLLLTSDVSWGYGYKAGRDPVHRFRSCILCSAFGTLHITASEFSIFSRTTTVAAEGRLEHTNSDNKEMEVLFDSTGENCDHATVTMLNFWNTNTGALSLYLVRWLDTRQWMMLDIATSSVKLTMPARTVTLASC
jgi:hypothetical protein